MKIGNNNITSVKIGTIDIQQVRIGTTLIWEKPVLMTSLASEESMTEPVVIETIKKPISVEQPKGVFTGMWNFVKNIFGIS